jgi:hypothetical protein
MSLLLSGFNETLIFSTDFRKIVKYKISGKSFQREPNCFLRTDRHDQVKQSSFEILRTRIESFFPIFRVTLTQPNILETPF